MRGGLAIPTLAAASTALLVSVSLDPGAARSAGAEGQRATASVSAQPPLHLGSRGSRVRTLEQRLVTLGYLPPGCADTLYGQRTSHAVVAFQGWQRLQRDGVVGPRTSRALASAKPPRPWVRLGRGLELDLERQVLLVVVGGRVQRAIHISSAAPGRSTPRGRFDVYRRERVSWSFPYRAWMPYALYFSGGYAIHGFQSVPTYPASHGCVRVPMSEAPFVYGATPLHTPVLIR